MPEGHKAMLKVIRAVEQDNRDFAHSLRQAGVAEKDIPPESRALRNLSIRERLNGKANITYQTTAPTTVRTISLVCDDVRENVYIPRIKLHSCPP